MALIRTAILTATAGPTADLTVGPTAGPTVDLTVGPTADPTAGRIAGHTVDRTAGPTAGSRMSTGVHDFPVRTSNVRRAYEATVPAQ